VEYWVVQVQVRMQVLVAEVVLPVGVQQRCPQRH
jgi:hypothetical protein